MADENKRTYEELSRQTTWRPQSVTEDSIRIGALLRIAASTEVMANNYAQLLSDIKYWRECAEDLEGQLKTERRRSAYRLGKIRRILKAKGISK